MTSIADKEANIVIPRKFDSVGNILSRGDLDGVADIVAQQTRQGPVRERVTRLVCKVGLHDRGRRREAGLGLDVGSWNRKGIVQELTVSAEGPRSRAKPCKRSRCMLGHDTRSRWER